MKLVSIIGARPQIIKAAALSRSIKNSNHKIEDFIVHTGQHYDHNMSQVFIEELGIEPPQVNLNVGSMSHAKQTSAILSGVEEVLLSEKPDWLVIYGDTNSTLAAAIAASKIHVPIVHIEAGLRSYNKSMPEEINRIVADHLSTLLFAPTKTGVDNLQKEGFNIDFEGPFNVDHPGVFNCGDLMYDNSLYFSELAASKTNILDDLNLSQNAFILATIHRDSNTDHPEKLNNLFYSLCQVAKESGMKVILPLHPRTKKMIELHLKPEWKKEIESAEHIKVIPPASFLEMIMLEKNAAIILTDSGGVQKEAFFFEKPCVILRPETEWVELVKLGAAIIADTNPEKIIDAFRFLMHKKDIKYEKVYGDGKAADHMLNTMLIHKSK